MNQTVRVNLHCHSVFSDGEFSPEELAHRLAAAGVHYAALTDHDSMAGVPRFHEALRRFNIGFVSGVEITTIHRDMELHLLAYGVDTGHEELVATLDFLKHARRSRVQGPLRQMPSQQPPQPAGRPAPGVVETGALSIREAIALVHRAGGRAFLAHPLVIDTDPDVLVDLTAELKEMGLDGLEGFSGQGTESQQKALRERVAGQGLLISAGTDLHHLGGNGSDSLYFDMPMMMWRQVARALSDTPQPASGESRGPEARQHTDDRDKTKRFWFFLRPRIVLPSLLAIALFATAIWGMVLPSLAGILIERKRDMIREFTQMALSLLAEAHREEGQGILTRSQAQDKARNTIGALRFGKDAKDYFWIQDMHPRMIMHPYRPDLNGRDLSGFKDSRGTPIFVEFTNIARRQDGGFAAYVWQWQDDPLRMAAKESYIVRFAPWQWVIGTGMYIDDVNQEIWQIEKNLTYALTGIVVLIFIVLLVNVRQSLAVERKRLDMEENLRLAEQRYRSLIEVTTEGTLLVLDGRCRYGNPTFLRMTGYSAEQLELQTLSDLLPQIAENAALWAYLQHLPDGLAGARRFDAVMAVAMGAKLECVVTLNPVDIAGKSGIILLARDLYAVEAVQQKRANQQFLERLATSLLFLQEPIGNIGAPAVFCQLEAPIHKAAAIMNAQNATCIVVVSDTGQPVGLVSDHDFRQRVAGQLGSSPQDPVRIIMSAPLITLSGQAAIYEALMLMEEKRVQHLAVVDEDGRVNRVVHLSQLLQFHRYGPMVLLREIAQAGDSEQVVRCCKRLPALVGALIQAGAKPRIVAHIVTAACDSATTRFIELATEDLGPPPAPFVFIAMGSQGRQEQTLLTDQDNAIIYQEPAATVEAPSSVDPGEYFLALGKKVCLWLDEAGYDLCDGGVMASNPKWCRSRLQWQEGFAEWILKAEPKELLDISICLDFRPVYGDARLAHDLREHIFKLLQDRPRFLPHLAQNALLFKPPARFLGKIIKPPGAPAEEAGKLNLKETLMPVVGFARLYALYHRLPYTHTLERIEPLEWKGMLQSAEIDAIAATYDFLMRRRFQAQLSRLEQGLAPDNCIVLNNLGTMEDAMLKQAFGQIDSLQKRIVHDFLGGSV